MTENSQATKKPFSTTSAAIAISFPISNPGASQCSTIASAIGIDAKKKMLIERTRTLAPENPVAERGVPLPARLGHAGDQPSGRELAKHQTRNLEAANESPAAAAHLTTVDHTGGAGVARQCGKAGVILVC